MKKRYEETAMPSAHRRWTLARPHSVPDCAAPVGIYVLSPGVGSLTYLLPISRSSGGPLPRRIPGSSAASRLGCIRGRPGRVFVVAEAIRDQQAAQQLLVARKADPISGADALVRAGELVRRRCVAP